MPPTLPRWLTKAFLVINILLIPIDLTLFFAGDEVVQPGKLSSAFAAGSAAIWMAMLGQHKQDQQITLLSIPFVFVMLLAIFGFTSYLLSACVSAAFIYLLITDLHAES
jgi:hypothetical protein